MDKQIQVLNDDSVAAVAIDHPCMHEWREILFAPKVMYMCVSCEFVMTNSEFNRYKELESQNG